MPDKKRHKPPASAEEVAILVERAKILDIFTCLGDAEKRDNRVFVRFRDALDTSRHIFYCMDVKSGRHDYISPWFAELTGYSLKELQSIGFTEFMEYIHPEDRQELLEKVSRLMAERTEAKVTWNAEYRFRKADGSWLTLNDWNTIWFDDHGEVEYYSGTIYDVTARKEAEEKARVSEETLREVFDAAPFPITVTTPREGEVLYVNKRVFEFYGLDPATDSVEGLRTPDFYVDPESRRRIVETLMAKGEVRDFVIEMRRKDGKRIWTSFSAKLTRFSGRDAIMSAQFDIDERVRSEEKLRESEEKFSKVFMNAPLIMGIADLETGLIADVNREFELFTGFARDELIGRRYSESGLVQEADRERILEILGKNGSVKGHEMQVVIKDGRRREIVYSGEKVNIDGRPMLLSIVEDVTEKRRQKEQELKAERLESLGVLAGGIAHDFNNILTGIMGNISLARALAELPDEVAERLLESEKACRRAGELSQQLLTFAKGGAPKKSSLRLAPLMEETATFALRGSNVKCEISTPDDLRVVEADRGQAGQLLSNLIINAAQAMPGGGVVRLAARNLDLAPQNGYLLAPGFYVALEVADEGCGIPEENIDRIFDPYFTTKTLGSGLGLSTVYSIARRHEGGVWARSTEGKGSIFTVLLPAVDGCEEVVAANGAPLQRAKGLRVLVMDDEAIIRDLASNILAYLGYEVDVASDGAEAVVFAKNATTKGVPYHAAILDLTVPGGMGGLEVSKIIRDFSPTTKLIVSSGYSSDRVMSEYADFGFCGAIAKPYEFSGLACGLEHVLFPAEEK